MQKSKFWLTVLLDADGTKWPLDLKGCTISLDSADTLQECDYPDSFRTSPVFPLNDDFVKPDFDSCSLYFYCFYPAFPALGRIQNNGSKQLINRICYSIGLASVLLISEKEELHKELLDIVTSAPHSFEIWRVKKQKIIDISPHVNENQNCDLQPQKIHNYKELPLTAKAVVDEFVCSIALIVPKVALHVPYELEVFVRLVNQVNELIDELVYLHSFEGQLPETLSEYSEQILKQDTSLSETITYQNLDRLIQINAALSYVSTQAVSGAVPIFERRSLIRRNSLLGIGTAIIALNNLTRSIELAFSQHSIEDIIADRMSDAKPLSGLEELPKYDASGWARNHSVDRWANKIEPREWYPKLPYYSGRLGFREAEHAISAAIQTLTAGASLEWSLLTLTHEILHWHVRKIFALIFQGDKDRLPEKKRKEFYRRYEASVIKKQLADETQLDSLRKIILTYCCRTITHGSLTRMPPKPQPIEDSGVREIKRDFLLPDPESLWQILEIESRNINEIWVHILDLHYFYASRISIYIPLIWQSWAAIPHVKGDLRQYILRSLLTISAKIDGKPYSRFKVCVDRLRELLEDIDVPLVRAVIDYLNDEQQTERMFESFTASLILVDLVNKVLVSQEIRGTLLSDMHVNWVAEEDGFEQKFEYKLPKGFVEEKIEKPAAYLLDRIVRRLREPETKVALEAETAKLFLACSSCLGEV